MLFFDEELLSVLLEEEAHSCGGDCGAPLDRVVHDRGEIEVLDHLERSPDLLPPTAELWSIKQVYKRTLECGHADSPTSVGLGGDSPSQVW